MSARNPPPTSNAVIKVGGGRGFVIEVDRWRYVVTAAHCLPDMPPAHAASHPSERTFPDLLGPLRGPWTVWAECVFCDPVADLALLATPDSNELSAESDAYDTLVEAENVVPFAIGTLAFVRKTHRLRDGSTFEDLPEAESAAQMLALDGRWFSCRVKSSGRSLWIEAAASPIRAGMSGSPILTPDGAAIGVVCVGSVIHAPDDPLGARLSPREGGPNPALFACLPAWLVVTVRMRQET